MSVTANTEVVWFKRDSRNTRFFRAGVSLHSHTMYSEESLEIVPACLVNAPFLRRLFRGGALGSRVRHFDMSKAFWTPPLSPRQAYRLEEKQIQRRFELPAIVSLTDHDDIRAGTLLRVMDRFRTAPVSTEWTVPFGRTFFHIGVHNLPPSIAHATMQKLAAFTAVPEKVRLRKLLHELNSLPSVLIVLNHPLWDEKGIGKLHHSDCLSEFVRDHGDCMHSLEVNGLRSWRENQQVLRLGRELNMPVIAGGDRHGLEPNAVLNLSRASDLAGFIDEVRRDRFSHIVLMPQYSRPRRLRIFQMVLDALAEHPSQPGGRRYCSERVFYRDSRSGEAVPLASLWGHREPSVLKHLLAVMRFVDKRSRSAILTNA